MVAAGEADGLRAAELFPTEGLAEGLVPADGLPEGLVPADGLAAALFPAEGVVEGLVFADGVEGLEAPAPPCAPETPPAPA